MESSERPAPALYVGVEGGGTRTSAALAYRDGTVLGIGEAGPSNFLAVGVSDAVTSTCAAIEAAWQAAGCHPQRLAGVAVCVAGAGRTDDPAPLGQIVQAIGADRVITASDIDAAWEAAFSDRTPGIVVIAGTGSNVIGRSTDGRAHQTGGWGHRIGDEGSGYWIGRKGLAAVARSHDGIEPPTAVTAEILRALGIDSPRQLHGVIYGDAADRRFIASLARPVFDAAAHGDTVALRIVAAAAEELAIAVAITAARMGDERPIPVARFGGLWHSPALSARFTAALLRHDPDMTIAPDTMPALGGAVLLALRAGTGGYDPAQREGVRRSIAAAPRHVCMTTTGSVTVSGSCTEQLGGVLVTGDDHQDVVNE